MHIRPRRLRQSKLFRDLVHEFDLSLTHLVQPYFLEPTQMEKTPIQGFTEIYRWPINLLLKRVESDLDRGLRQFLLFGSDPAKDESGSGGFQGGGVVQNAVRELKKQFGKEFLIITDVCLCPYTSHGHCGLLKDGDGDVDNDSSLSPLAEMAVSHALAGADMVAPSDMMDGRVGVIRTALDKNSLTDVAILAYTAKYASNYYGPFRQALGSSPQGMDRSSYQMDFRNAREALRELRLDIEEGADLVMVKPALPYLDIIYAFHEVSEVPVAAYSVSGEYEMVKRMAASGLVEESRLVLENLTAIRRAGAGIVITYYASEIAEKGWLR